MTTHYGLDELFLLFMDRMFSTCIPIKISDATVREKYAKLFHTQILDVLNYV